MRGKIVFTTLASVALALGMAAAASPAMADSGPGYRVEITNLTRGQTFTPVLLASHKAGLRIFNPGQPASLELEALAEAGDITPLENLLISRPDAVLETAASAGPVPPGASVTLTVPTQGAFTHISLGAMLVPTNDAFFSLTDMAGPRGNKSAVHYSPAYDAGTEPNSELCADIPGGGGCAGEGLSAEDGEGYVHIHAGIHGIGDLAENTFDWRNPVARIVISRVPAM
ncbi:spondin domain-containing protein [Ferruginivarius sediminum]|uniref:Uncharacterized protein n=1 Tax=Ferruginivarius sediminum TaxID=2661937 RepID=A0A369T711_9PROT|nr:spondin domain-containing protein [Ferruginivarius sediminum]RDD61121.1 hypothetical protein DRB17_14575 [Ferruginivarius sediminum]